MRIYSLVPVTNKKSSAIAALNFTYKFNGIMRYILSLTH